MGTAHCTLEHSEVGVDGETLEASAIFKESMRLDARLSVRARAIAKESATMCGSSGHFAR